MIQKKVPLKEKIKCPICNHVFIPDSFHFEKTHFDTVETKGEQIRFHDKSHQLVIKPFTSIKGSWITYCPECAYIIRFATEIGEKEVVDEHHRLLKRGEFQEFGKEYKFTYHTHEKPYMDKSDYFMEKADNIKKGIKNALDKIDFEHWGAPYREWKSDKDVDSFKFLIHFFTVLEDFCNSQVEDFKSKTMEQKIKDLNLPAELEEIVESIRELKNKIAHQVYELSEEEEKLVEKAFIELVHYLVKKQLEPLKLNAIRIEPEYDFIDINKINYEIQKFLHLYLETILQIKDFQNSFLIPLMKDLGIFVE